MMRRVSKHFPCLLLFMLIVLLSGCSGPKLGQEFALAPGENVIIPSENLRIKFLEVTEDSRCPQNVTCIWAGQVVCAIEIGDARSSEQLTLTRVGGAAEFSSQGYRDYVLFFDVQPYPVAGETIAKDAYRLILIMGKATAK